MIPNLRIVEKYNQTIPPHEAAQVLGVSLSTLAVWRCTGRYNLPYIKVGRKIRYRLADLEAWLETRSRQHTGQSKGER